MITFPLGSFIPDKYNGQNVVHIRQTALELEVYLEGDEVPPHPAITHYSSITSLQFETILIEKNCFSEYQEIISYLPPLKQNTAKRSTITVRSEVLQIRAGLLPHAGAIPRLQELLDIFSETFIHSIFLINPPTP